jgi:ribonuclease T
METPETYISVDVETAGPIPGAYSLLAIGACVVGKTNESFYVELRPINDAFVPSAIKVINKTLKEFAENGRDPINAIQEFHTWISRTSKETTPVFVGFNAPFDWSFINWYFHTYLGENPFGFAGLDIKSYYMGMARCAWADTRSSRIPAQFKGTSLHTHHALHDAIEQAEMFERMRRFRSNSPS